jgi:2-dehydro-3-deoxyphosphogluconate aldolase/(4S)-4-hydroxy-2-oxoglutarate aldolase
VAASIDLRDAFIAAPVLAVLRGLDPKRAVDAAEVCWAAGVVLVEVSRSHDPGFDAVRAVCARAHELGRVAGAGTVCTAEDVRAAVAARAAFAVAPGFAREAADAARAVGLPYLPGVATPSEVQEALASGFRTLKLFPARELGPGWIRALAGPFPEVRFVAVGGVTAANASEFVEAGAIAVAIGSGLDPTELPALLERLRAIGRK